MRYKLLTAAFAAAVAMPFAAPAFATDLEVTHWWTSGGESAAVAEFAKAFDATGNKWVDGAIAGAGNTARPIMVARITGGDPMGAFQFNTGRQAEELIEAGLLRDLTDVATKEKWSEVIRPASLLEGCQGSRAFSLQRIADAAFERLRLQFCFDEIIRRARPHGLDVDLVLSSAGEQNDRGLATLLERGSQ